MDVLDRRAGTRPPAGRRSLLAAVVAVVMAAAGLVATAGPAAADGPTSFSNTTAIPIPATGSADQMGPASPYPSGIAVSGLAGSVSKVTVTFSDLTHSTVNDIDAMVVAPSGANLIVLSDVGDPNQLVTASNIDLTFDDAAAGPVPAVVTLPSGTYRPTNIDNGPDTFPVPAPAPSTQTTLSGAFTGIDPNGTWKLYVVDDTSGDTGTMAGGWSLSITTEVAAVPTTTTVATSTTPSTTGSAVTFTAAVKAGATPVTAGSVQFTADGTNLGSPVALDGSGHAALTTAALAEGTHLIRATYGGATGFLSSNGSVSQRVDNQTVVAGNTFCNTGPMAIPLLGPAQPYPSHITVSGLPGKVTKVTATLKGVSHQAPIDIDAMLAGPTPSQNLLLMSDAGGQNPVSNLDLTFDDAAAGPVPAPAVSGTYTPTNVDDGSSDTFPAPAPAASGATALSTFNGASGNGQWSLYVRDDASGDSGSIAGGWCLTITSQAVTATTLTAAPNPSTHGSDVTFTATVTSGGSPVTTGAVQFTDGGTPLGAPVPITAGGTATLTTSALSTGSHTVTAAYAGTVTLAESSDSLTQVVDKLATTTTLASAPDPSDPGQSVTLTATVTSGGSPVTTGSVQFADGGTPLGGPVPVAADGTASVSTSALAAGSHPLSAAYQGTATYAGSSGTATHGVRPVADAGGPYTVAEGGAVTLDASGSTPGATYAWDLNGDNNFSDASGATPTLTRAELEALGIDDGPSNHTVTLRVTQGALTSTGTATLHVTNAAPTAVVTGALTATAGTPFTVKVGADDPSSADLAASFAYAVDWGDGSPVESVTGPADPPVTHTYQAAGSYPLSVTATDKDGGAGAPTTVTVQVGAAPPVVHDPSITARVSSSHARTGYGWYRAPVTVTFTCTPHGSPLTTPCPVPVRLTRNGAGQSVTRSIGATDGGTASVTVRGINLDQTSPRVAVRGVRAGKRYLGPVPSARCHGRDALSGLAACTLRRVRHGDRLTYVATATDKAGNKVTSRVTITVVKAAVAGAPFRKGAYTMRVGKSYTLIAYGAKRPRYVNAAVFPNPPAGAGARFHKVGHHRWAATVTFATAAGHRYWNVGIRIGHTVHVLKIRLR